MFTGIIETIGEIKKVNNHQGVKSLEIYAPEICDDLSLGDSVAVNGVCLTVTKRIKNHFTVDVITGTRNITYLDTLSTNDTVNLERAMLANGRFGGHFVSGHVDGKGRVKSIVKRNDEWIIEIDVKEKLLNQMIDKGSVTVDGISLTIFNVYNRSFEIHLIPETRERTVFSTKKQGDNVHIETDLLFKYVQKVTQTKSETLTFDKILSNGF